MRPENYAVWVDLGELLGASGPKLNEALECLKKAVELDPNLAGLQANELGLVLKIKGQLDEATACEPQGHRTRPESRRGPRQPGGACSGTKGQLEDAIFEFAKARELKPTSAEIHSATGSGTKAQGRSRRGHRQPQGKLLELDPKDALDHYNLGPRRALSQKGQPDEAIASYRIAVERNPKNAEAHTNLGLPLSARGQD